MNTRFLLPIVALLLVVSSSAFAQKSIPGLLGVKWGASPTEVKAAMKKIKGTSFDASLSKPDMLAFTGGKYDGSPILVCAMRFNSDRFHSGTLILEYDVETDTDVLFNVYDGLKRKFQREFGIVPTDRGEADEALGVDFDTPNERISVYINKDLRVIVSFFTIKYRDETDEAADETSSSTPTSSLFSPTYLSGTGDQATRMVTLPAGLMVVKLSHSGDGHFSVWLVDGDGENVELLANTTEPRFDGSKAVQIERAGSYLFNVSAEGRWTISTSRPSYATSSRYHSGSGPAASDLFEWDGGLARFSLSHYGEGHFSVWLLDETGERIELLANDVGTYSGSMAVKLPAGKYIFDVDADGRWSVSF